ncbi:MAG: CAP domain-containing protein [Actinomycetota bacterium]
MDNEPTNPIFARAIVLLVAVAAAGGAVFALGRSSTEPAGEGLPASPVQGMVNADDTVLAAPVETSSTTRPVLAVTPAGGEDAGVGAGAGATAGAEASTTPSTVASTSPPTTVGPPTSASTVLVSSTAPPPADSSTTTIAVSSTTSTPGDPSTTTSMPPTTDPSGISEVELEIARLTNELRTNPNGPLRREGPVINCDGRLPIDQATGLYQPVAAVEVHPEASLQVARPWSAQMTTDLQHRPEAGIPALIAAGIQVMAAGENIAYHNFPDTAYRHFAGWRESDGHFCNLMDPTFTHLGVGESLGADGFSYATQNFFSMS